MVIGLPNHQSPITNHPSPKMENLFAALSHQDSIAFLLSVLVAFLIGFITAWILWGSRASRYRREAEKWKLSHDNSQVELAALREQFDLREADLVKAQREAQEARDYAAHLQADKAHWQSDLDSAIEENVKLQTSLRSYSATIEDLNHQILGLKTHYDQVDHEATQDSEALNQVMQMQSNLQATMQRLTTMEDKISALTNENAALREAADTNSQWKEVQQSFEEAAIHLATLEAKIDDVASENEALKMELASLTGTQTSFELAPAPDLQDDDDEEIMEAGMEPEDVADEIFPEAETEEKLEENEAILPVAEEVAATENVAFSEGEAELESPVALEESENGIGIAPVVDLKSSPAQDEVLAAIGTKIPTASEAEKDDLTLIKGIGSFLEKKLNRLGIYTFEQISRFDDDLTEKVTAAIEFFPGRIKRDDWVGQAARLAQIKKENPDAIQPAGVFPKNPQDLKIVEGVGPKIEQLLKQAGIKTLQDLAATSEASLKEILAEAGESYQIHDPASWPWQADLAAKGEWKQLQDYQDYLVGGQSKGR